MTIPTLPPLERTSPSFAADLDTFFAINLPATIPAFNAEIARINGIGFGSYSGNSTTSLVSGPGSKTFTVETGKSFTSGQYLMAASVSSPSVFMSGQVTSYDPLTGALVLSVTDTGGAGTTKADWSIAPSAVVLRPTKVGDVFQGAVKPTADTWLPLGGSLYLQSSYAELFGILGLIADSPNNVKTWTAKTMPSSANWSRIAYGNGGFVAIISSATNKCATSTDGSTWTQRTMSSSQNWKDVAFGAGVFVAMAGSGGAVNTAATSPNGITWTTRNMPGAYDWRAVTYANGKFYCLGGAKCATSTDGITWSMVTIAYDQLWEQLVYGNGILIATIESNKVYTSSDGGVTWVERSLAFYSTGITFGNGLFVITTQSDYCYTSTDGVTWVERDTPVFGGGSKNWRAPAYGGGVFIMMNYGTTEAAVSFDGKVWEPATLPSAANWRNAAYGDGYFVATPLGANTVALKSSSAITYDKATQFFLPESVNTPGIAQWIRGL